MSDVIVAGGGVIGLSIAWELANHGARVKVLEQGSIGHEASWAGAGMLPPGNLAGETTAEGRLRALSHELWPEWTSTLQSESGVNTEFLNSGALELSFDRSLTDEIETWRNAGTPVESLTQDQLHACEPELSRDVSDAFRLPTFSQVRNPRHLKALVTACLEAGVEIVEGEPVCSWKEQGGQVIVETTSAEFHAADHLVVSAGAWSGRLLAAADASVEIAPVRGQIVLLKCRHLPFRHVLQVGPRYLVPRADGRILIGSTEERAGFVKQNTVKGVLTLLEFAEKVVPALQGTEVERTWSGLRPHLNREEPVIGKLPGSGRVIVATGHFRSGLQMSPGTAMLVRQLILSQEPTIPLDGYSFESLKASLAPPTIAIAD